MTKVSNQQPIALVGMGCLFPKAGDVTRYWANICRGVDAITDVPATHWKPEDYLDPDPKAPDRVYVARGGFIDPVNFPPLDYGIAPNTLEATDTTQLLGMLVARAALADAGYGPGRDFDRNRVSIILGVTSTLELVVPLGARLGHPRWRKALAEAGVDPQTANDVVQRISDSYVGWQEDSFPGLLGNVAAGRIANRLDLGGTNCVVDAACASSLGAVHLAMLELAAGRCDMVLSGGLDTFNDIFMYMCFSKTPALSPTGNARPFDAQGDGTILGEGLGIVVLKRLADAERDGDRIYAVLKSIGTSSDGKGNAIYAPSPAGQAKALRQAYLLADVTPQSIELVEAHGTGTKAGDAAELTALVDVYRPEANTGKTPAKWCAIGSVKSQIGHTKAAAGVAGLIKASLALYHKVLPPTIKVQRPLPSADAADCPFYVNAQERPWLPSGQHPRRAALSSFGFGGSNFHCVLEEHGAAKPAIDWDGDVQILAFSAASRAELGRQLEAFQDPATWPDLRGLAGSLRSNFKHADAVRLIAVLERDGDAAKVLNAARTALAKYADKASWSTPERVYFGSGAPAGTLAWLFPGQGSQYPGMLRELACRFPALQAALADASAAFATSGRKLGDFIYPPSVFSEEGRRVQEEALRSTDVAQPALGAVSLGALRVLEEFGIRADVAAGHSYGELVALCAAGRISTKDLCLLSMERGRLMAACAGDAGSMLAVRAKLADVEKLLRDERLDLVIANKNAPEQCVLSGRRDEIERAAAACQSRGLTARPLVVSAAFHSPLVAGVQTPFARALDGIDFTSGLPVYANSTGLPYPHDRQSCAGILAGQLAQPVEFVQLVENMYGAGVRTFVEVGPGTVLTGLARSILGDRPCDVLAVDSSAGKKAGTFDLACVLGALAASGRAVALDRWDAGYVSPPVAKKPTLTIPLSGANYVKPRAERPAAPAQPVANSAKKPAAPPASSPMVERKPVALPRSPAPERREQPPMATREASMTEPNRTAAPSTEAVRVTQENLAALQRLGEQTAQLHRQFLDGQDRLLGAMQSLLEQQQQLLHGQPLRSAALAAPAREAQLPQLASGGRQPPGQLSDAHAPVPGETTQVPLAQPVASSVRAAGPRSPANVDTSSARTTVPVPAAAAVLLGVVAEKTGYPVEMLELDMELDADLGIDSIKRVEILSAVQEKLPEAPAVKSEHLGTLRTLRQVADFLGEAPAAPVASAPGSPGLPVQGILLDIVSAKTGYPVEMLELDMELDADLGIDSIKRVEIFSAVQEQLPAAPAVKSEHLGTLRTLRAVVAFLGDAPAPTAGSGGHRPPDVGAPTAPAIAPVTETAATSLDRFVVESVPLSEDRAAQKWAAGEWWITEEGSGLSASLAARLDALGQSARVVPLAAARQQAVPADLAGLVVLAPPQADAAFLKDALFLVQHVGPTLRRRGQACLATVSRQDGHFGLRDDAGEPTSGGLAGLAKTAAREWPEVACKAIDLATSHSDADEAALVLADELFRSGPVEVGLSRAGRFTLEMRAEPAHAGSLPIRAGEVIVASGGARGVTAETLVALAHACQPTLIVLGRTPLTAEPAELAACRDESTIKQALLARAGKRLAPRELEEQYRNLMAAREARRNLERMQAAGARVVYRDVDVRDAAAVGRLLTEVRQQHGPIRGLLHGAGVLADRLIADKTEEQFERVYGTKVDGLRTLLAALQSDELAVLALFSSTTGRLGRAGQVDYAMANEVLNKLAQHEARRRPGCRVVAVNWGPWAGGMVSPNLRDVFAREGVGLIPLQEGADQLVRELQAPARSAVEVVVLARPEGEAAPARNGTAEVASEATSNGSVRGGARLDMTIDIERLPVLRGHVLDGQAVLPMALMMEWLAHAALHGNPGLIFHGFDELRVLKGLRLEPTASTQLRVVAGKAQKQDRHWVVAAELLSAGGRGKETLHARAQVVLTAGQSETPPAAQRLELPPARHAPAEIYEAILFHGPELHGIEKVLGSGPAGIAVRAAAAPAPGAWLRQPWRSSWLGDPLAVDVALQAIIVWGYEHKQTLSLPCAAGRYRQYRRTFPPAGVRVQVAITRTHGAHIIADVDWLDDAGAVVARMEACEFIADSSLEQAFRRNRLEQEPLGSRL